MAMNPLQALLAAHGAPGASGPPAGPLGALMAAHAPAGPPQGQPRSITVQDHGGPAGGGDVTGSLQRAIAATHQAVVAADDQNDKQALLQCLTKMQAILANEQKQKEAMLGTTAAHKGMAKASAQNGY